MDNNTNYYIDKDELWQSIEDYYKADDEDRAKGGDGIMLPNSIGDMLMTMAERIMSAQNFSNYPYRDQMVGDAVIRMVLVITKRKFNLWSQEIAWSLEESKYKGFKMTDKCKEILEENPEYIFSPYSEKLDGSVMVLKPKPDHFYLDINNKKKQVYYKVKVERGMFVKNKKGTVKIHNVLKDDKDKPLKGLVIGNDDKPIIMKNNAFGYLSLIATREGVTRLKREDKNYNAVNSFQKQEYLNFLCENPEIAPQRVDDDTYDSFEE